MGKASKKKRAPRNKSAPDNKDASEPYAYVSACDFSGAFGLLGVHPNPKKGDFAIYVIVLRCVEGVRDGFIRPRERTESKQLLATHEGDLVVKMTVAQAMALFLDPLIARTKTMPAKAIPCIRWFERYRQPGVPHPHQDLVQPFLSPEQLQCIGQYDDTVRDAAPLVEDDDDDDMTCIHTHGTQFEQHFLSSEYPFYKTSWFMSEGDLQEIGVTVHQEGNFYFVNPTLLTEKWVQNPRLLQRSLQITAHMRLLFALAEKADLSELWGRDLEIQLAKGRFAFSGLAQCVCQKTISALNFTRNRVPETVSAGRCTHYLFADPLDEKMGRAMLRSLGSWYCFLTRTGVVQPEQDILFCDLKQVVSSEFRLGLLNVNSSLRALLPGHVEVFDPDMLNELTDCLLSEYTVYYAAYVAGNPARALQRPETVPPPELVVKIKEIVAKSKTHEIHSQPASEAISGAFWDLVCMTIHPDAFDFPAELGGRAVRKRSSGRGVERLPSRPRALPVLSELVYDATVCFFASHKWTARILGAARLELVQQSLTVAANPDELPFIRRHFGPERVTLDGGDNTATVSVAKRLLRRAQQTLSIADNVFPLFTEMARIAPFTTMELLKGIAQLGDILNSKAKKDLEKLERRRSSSTTKPARHCNSCGKVDQEGQKLHTCSRCRITRYCSAECQRADWKRGHKKICIPADLKC